MNDQHLSEAKQQQLTIEAEMHDAGLERYRKAIFENADKETPKASQTWDHHLLTIIAAVSDAIGKARTSTQRGRATRLREGARLLPSGIPSDQLALITVRRAVDILSLKKENQRSLGALIRSIASDVEHVAARQEAKEIIARNAQEAGHQDRQDDFFLGDAAEWQPWTTDQRHKVGNLLVNCLFETDRLCRSVRTNQGPKKDKHIIVIKPELAEQLTSVDLRSDLLSPHDLPMVTPPLPWGHGKIGGYLTGSITPRYSLITPRYDVDPDAWKGANEAIDKESAQGTLAAVNVIQETPWRIDEEALKAAVTFHDEDDQADVNERLKRASVLDMAERFKTRDRLFMPAKLDFRCRAYSRCHLLSPQGDDMKRSLLTFAEGQPVTTDRDIEWLKIQGANLFGIDKEPLKERMAWVDDHFYEIRDAARDSSDETFLKDAEKPLQFLAWCREFMRIREGGAGTLTHLPCAIDGTCNALQHLAAIMRDERAGASVNLLPGYRPRDIYGEIATRINKEICRKHDHEWHVLAVFGIDRKLTKMPIIATFYGGTRWKIINDLKETLKQRAIGKPAIFTKIVKEQGNDLAKFLYDHIMAAMRDQLKGLMTLRDWLQKVTGIVAKRENKNLIWTPPHGITVTQPYVKLEGHLLRTDLGNGEKMQLQYRTLDKDQPDVDKRRAKNGIGANLVHSLDASHMFATVGRAKKEGIRSFHMIHDSFGTHCTRMDDLSRITRETFVEMYENYCPLEALLEELEGQVSRATMADLPPIPEKGNLDLSKVLDSEYFFC